MKEGVIGDLLKAALAFASVIGIFLSVRRRIVGLEGIVIQGKSPGAPIGPGVLISVNGQKWRAVAADGSYLQAGEKVVVLKVQGLDVAVVSRKSTVSLPDGDVPPMASHRG